MAIDRQQVVSRALGQAYAELEDHEIALTYFEHQITVAQEARARDIEAEALMCAGSSYGALGHVQRAGAGWRKALAILELMGDQRVARTPVAGTTPRFTLRSV